MSVYLPGSLQMQSNFCSGLHVRSVCTVCMSGLHVLREERGIFLFMELNFDMTEDILIAKIGGELDHHNALVTREDIDKTMDVFHCRHLILDFSGVSFTDSSGIGMVMGRYNKVKAMGGSIYISGASQYVRRILEMAGIFTIVGESPTSQEAICAIEDMQPGQIKMEVMSDEKQHESSI